MAEIANFVVVNTYRFMADFVTSHTSAAGFSTRQKAETFIANGEKYHPGRFSSQIFTKAEYKAMVKRR